MRKKSVKTTAKSTEAITETAAKVKETVKIPVIGNGDLKCAEDVEKALKFSKVDGVMIGRATLGNPWIFTQTLEYLKTGNKLPKPSNKERLDTILKHIDLEIEEKGERVAIKEMRKHISAYTKSLKDSSQFRNHMNTLETREEVVDYLKEYFSTL